MFGSFCPRHAEEMRQVRIQPKWHGRDVMCDALAVAYAVLGAGQLRKKDIAQVLPSTGAARDLAFDVATARGWLVSRGSSGFVPGPNLPPNLSLELRALVLAQDVRDSVDVDEINAEELALAVERGWLTADLEPTEIVPFVGPKVSLIKRPKKKRVSVTIPPKAPTGEPVELVEPEPVEVVVDDRELANMRAVVEAIEAATAYPMTRAQVRAVTGLPHLPMRAALARAVADGLITVRTGAKGGFYPADSATTVLRAFDAAEDRAREKEAA